MSLVLIVAGLFTASVAYANPDWYFENRKAQLWMSIFGGRENARVALIVVGVIFFIIGLVASPS